MSFLSVFPETVVNEILSIWISLEDVRNVDGALCSKDFRNEFLEIISGPHFVMPWPSAKNDSKPFNLKQRIYLWKRKIKLEFVSVDERSFTEITSNGFNGSTVQCFQLFGECDESLTGNDRCSIDVSAFVQSLSELAVIRLISTQVFTANNVTSISPTVIERLTELDLNYTSSGDVTASSTLEYLTKHCRVLRVLKLSTVLYDKNDDETREYHTQEPLTNFFRASPNLVEFCLKQPFIASDVLNALADHCPNLQRLTHDYSDACFDGWSAAGRIIQKCTQLQQYSITTGNAPDGLYFHQSKATGATLTIAVKGILKPDEYCDFLATAMTRVETLIIDGFFYLDDDICSVLEVNSTVLRSLVLSNYHISVHASDVYNRLVRIETLSSLTLDGVSITGDALLRKFSNMTNIKHLRVYNNPMIFDIATGSSSATKKNKTTKRPRNVRNSKKNKNPVIELIHTNPQLVSFTCDTKSVQKTAVEEYLVKTGRALEVYFV